MKCLICEEDGKWKVVVNSDNKDVLLCDEHYRKFDLESYVSVKS